ncbi:MAG: hypothetical protein KGI71_01175, partial [Patescibacteria group bacterium]|nr:hypothetical protein [Patescibacteria group bacterium]
GDPCTKSDGTPGVIKTPGTVIKATLDKALGTTFDKLVQMGDISAEINQIMGNIATVMNTVNFASQILGGFGSNGLFGVGQTYGTSGSSQLSQYQNSSGYLGATQSGVQQNATQLSISGSDMLSLISQYQSAWNTINTSATAASTSVNDLINFCTQQTNTGASGSNTAIISSAQTALTSEIAPVFTQVAAANAVIAAAQALVQKIQNEASTGGGTYATDLQTLQTMPPTSTDVANAQQQAQVVGNATASPSGSLNVSANSLVDQMNLISTNAQALKDSCTTPPSSP